MITTARIDTDTWTLRTLREAKAYRDSIGEPDAYWDARLADTEAAVREVGTVTERPAAEAELPDSAVRAHRLQGSSYGTRNAPSDAQLRFLTSLHRDLGTEAPTPRDKAHASLLIDGAKKAVAALRASGAAAPTAYVRPQTEGQRTFLADLLATRVHDFTAEQADGWNFAQASEAITRLKDAPRVRVAAHGIPEGRYAVELGGAPAQFYRVGRTGRITVQAGPAEHPYRGQLNEGLRWIAENTRDAAALYGRLLGVCGMCGRELTDEASRARGLGPICASK